MAREDHPQQSQHPTYMPFTYNVTLSPLHPFIYFTTTRTLPLSLFARNEPPQAQVAYDRDIATYSHHILRLPSPLSLISLALALSRPCQNELRAPAIYRSDQEELGISVSDMHGPNLEDAPIEWQPEGSGMTGRAVAVAVQATVGRTCAIHTRSAQPKQTFLLI